MMLQVRQIKPIKVSSVRETKERILSKPNTLSQCYVTFSTEKKNVYYNCRETHKTLDEMGNYWHTYYCIYSHSRYMFTYYGLFERVNKETGEVELWGYYSTKTRNVIFRIIEE